MPDGKGYLLPDNVQPEGLLCLKIYIPNDSTGFYLSAMSGAFSDMGRWLQWEKDGTDRASLAAATWKEAIDFTYENGWLECGMDCCEQIDDILDRLTEIENMNINVNCGGGCGCGCGNGSENNFLDPTILPENPVLPDEPEFQEGDEVRSLAGMCAVATQYADGIVDTMQKMKTFFGGIQVTIASVDAFLLSITKIKPFKLVLSPLVFLGLIQAVIAIILSAELTDRAFEAAQEYRDAIKCAIYGATSPANAKSRYLGVVKTIQDDWGFAVAALFWFLGQVTDWRKVVTDGEGEIFAEYVGSTCLDCGAVGNIPNNVTGYEWRIAAVTATNTHEYTSSLQLLGNGYRYTANIDDPPTVGWEEDQSAFFPDLEAGEEIVAFAWRALEASAPGASDPLDAVYNWNVVIDGPFWAMWVSEDGTIREDLEGSAPFDLITEVTPVTYFVEPIESPRTSSAITPGFPGPVPIVLDVRGFAFCVKLA